MYTCACCSVNPPWHPLTTLCTCYTHVQRGEIAIKSKKGEHGEAAAWLCRVWTGVAHTYACTCTRTHVFLLPHNTTMSQKTLILFSQKIRISSLFSCVHVQTFICLQLRARWDKRESGLQACKTCKTNRNLRIAPVLNLMLLQNIKF